ncbi:MAG: outer membrane beta-barrel protein [Ignavibacteria bacterium]|nr:outer membrane beta-barrel protein [Ignavibacteria bacterium]
MKNSRVTNSESLIRSLNPSIKFSVGIIILIALMTTQINAQVNIKLGGGLGMMSPASDLSGSTIEYYNGTNYGLGSGLNINGKAKLGFAAFNLTGEIDYSSLSNSGNSEPGQGSVELSQKIVSIKVGPEFRLGLPMIPVTPYLGFNLAMNSFSGEITFQGVAKVPSATYSMKSATRFGVGFYAGTEVSVGPFLSLDFNLSYNLMNVSGKEWNDANPGINQRIDSYLSLNDAADPIYNFDDDKHFVSKARSIHSVLFTVSLLFGL